MTRDEIILAQIKRDGVVQSLEQANQAIHDAVSAGFILMSINGASFRLRSG